METRKKLEKYITISSMWKNKKRERNFLLSQKFGMIIMKK